MANPGSFGSPKKRLDHSATAPPAKRSLQWFHRSAVVHISWFIQSRNWQRLAGCNLHFQAERYEQKNGQSGLKKAPSVGQFNSVWLQDKTFKSFFSSKFWIEFVFNFFWRLRTSGEFFGPILLKYSEAVNWFIMWKVITKLVLLTNQEKPWPYFFSTITCGRQPLSNDPRFCQ